jgi:hypothetical protein
MFVDADVHCENHFKLQQIFVALKTHITDEQGACLKNMGGDSSHSG